MADASNAKPRVLLSVMKGEGFEALGPDTSDLFTAIIAGFGRFECERVLKPSGVELMNLSQSANIEISVSRRDRETGRGSLLYRGLVPLGTLHPAFFARGGEGGGGGEPQVWESWLGLFSADVSLKGQSPDRVFQQCLDMGSTPSRGNPRLYLRLQYLQPGTSAAPRAPPTASDPGLDPMKMSIRGQLNTHQGSSMAMKSLGTGMLAGHVYGQQDFNNSTRLQSSNTTATATAEVDKAHQRVVEALREELKTVKEQLASEQQLTKLLQDKSPVAAGPFYVPNKTDPVDLLVASNLLRLISDPTTSSTVAAAAAGLIRLEPNKYRLGPEGPTIQCHINLSRDSSGPVMVHVISGSNNESQSEPIELGEFLAKGNVPREV